MRSVRIQSCKEPPLAQPLGIAPYAAAPLADIDLEIAAWRQRDRYYEIPPLSDPVIPIHVGGIGRVRFGDGGCAGAVRPWAPCSSCPSDSPPAGLVQDGEVEHVPSTAPLDILLPGWDRSDRSEWVSSPLRAVAPESTTPARGGRCSKKPERTGPARLATTRCGAFCRP